VEVEVAMGGLCGAAARGLGLARRGGRGGSRGLSDAAAAAAAVVVAEDLGGGFRAAVVNRPRQLNALDAPVIAGLTEVLQRWEGQPLVQGVLLKGAGEKAFCAGGDVKAVVAEARTGDLAKAAEFFRQEYRLNALLGRMRTPVVAILDGIVMGGGCGISMHGAFRVATERALLAMPECALGLFPDVGGSHFLPRLCPGNFGTFLGLTGHRLRGFELKAAGLATHFVPSARLPSLERRLADLGPLGGSADTLDAVLQGFEAEGEVPPGSPLRHLAALDECFGAATVEDVQDALRARCEAVGEGAPEGEREVLQVALKALAKGSPTSMKVTLQQLAAGRSKSLEECLKMEFRLVHRFLEAPDFAEGVRALLEDKDGEPKWSPGSLSAVTKAAVESYFAPLPEGIPELAFGGRKKRRSRL